MIILTTLIGTLLTFITIYIYGRFFIRICGNRYYHPILALITGTASLILSSYILKTLQFASLTALILGIALAWYIRTKQWQKEVSALQNQLDKLSLLIIITATILFAGFNFTSGITTDLGFAMRGTNSVDGYVHLAYAKIMDEGPFPPTRPVFANQKLVGYHYFYTLLVVQLHDLFPFSFEDYLFRIMPIFLAFSYGASFYLFAKNITNSHSAQRFILLAAYFSYSTIPLIPNFTLGYPGLLNPLSLVHNPSTLLSIAFLLTAFTTLLKLHTHISYIIFAAMLFGVIPQTKIYAGIIGIGTLAGYLLLRLVILAQAGIHHRESSKFKVLSSKEKTKITSLDPFRTFMVLVVSAFIAFCTFYLNNSNSGSLVWAPFLYFDHFMEQTSLVNLHWPERKLIFLANDNWPQIILLYFQAVGLFLLLHLGTRIFAFANFKSLLNKDFYIQPQNQILLIALLISTVIPTFFIQSIAVFDIGQFFWLGATLMAIPTGFGLEFIYRYIRVKISIIIISLTFFLLPFTLAYISEARTYLFNPPDSLIPPDQIELFRYITQTTLPKDFFLFIPPTDTSLNINWPPAPIVSALTSRSSYYQLSGTPFAQTPEARTRNEILQTAIKLTHQCQVSELQTLLASIKTIHMVTARPTACLTNSDYVDDFVETKEFSYYKFKNI